jgi:hypothetical protein
MDSTVGIFLANHRDQGHIGISKKETSMAATLASGKWQEQWDGISELLAREHP